MEGAAKRVACPACKKRAAEILYCKRCKVMYCQACGKKHVEHPESVVYVTRKRLVGTPDPVKPRRRKRRKKILTAAVGVRVEQTTGPDPLAFFP